MHGCVARALYYAFTIPYLLVADEYNLRLCSLNHGFEL